MLLTALALLALQSTPITLTAEVVTVDAAGIHLADRQGRFWVAKGAAADAKSLPRGTVIRVTGLAAPPEPAAQERPILDARFDITEPARAPVQRPAQVVQRGSFPFDDQAPVLLRGKVDSIAWTPIPTIRLTMIENGQPKAWLVEAPYTNRLARSGATPATLKPGADIIVRGYQSVGRVCVPECKALAADISIPDGRRTIFNASGAPRDTP